jgi:hypothetical protein
VTDGNNLDGEIQCLTDGLRPSVRNQKKKSYKQTQTETQNLGGNTSEGIETFELNPMFVL